jgi:diketogulonate reductase-like aldo/keto reductase
VLRRFEAGAALEHKTLERVAERLTATPAQVALAWVLRQPGVIAIPKASHVGRVRENYGTLQVALGREDLAALDAAFPPPTRRSLSRCSEAATPAVS